MTSCSVWETQGQINGTSMRLTSRAERGRASSMGKEKRYWKEDRDTGHMQCKSILIFIPFVGNVSHVFRQER
jgi:hypothetical protein